MSRVAWSRLSGEEIEQMAAMFIGADHPRSTRITPSRGDGGVDVLLKEDATCVFQVKRFSAPLTPGQKKQVEHSVDRLRTDPRVRDWQVDEWHLVTPWDPTLEARDWLNEYVTSRGLPEPIWDGLTQFDIWAGKYPEIVDYFHQGNTERIHKAAIDLARTFGATQITAEALRDFNASSFATKLQEATSLVNKSDPNYEYRVSTGRFAEAEKATRLEKFEPEPGFLLTKQWDVEGHPVRVDVYVKNRVGVSFKPSSIDLRWHRVSGSADAAIADHLRYGSPLELPIGSVSGSLTAPGGLGGDFENAALTIQPDTRLSANIPGLRLVLFSPDGCKIAEMPFRRDYLTVGMPLGDGPRGAETKLTDASGVLTVVMRWDADTQTVAPSFILTPPHGRLAQDVLPALRFFSGLRPGNSLTIAPLFGPIHSAREVLPETFQENPAQLFFEVASALNLIQEHTPLPLHIPDEEAFKGDLISIVKTAGDLLGGQTVKHETGALAMPHDPEAVVGEQKFMTIVTPRIVPLPEGEIDLGLHELTFTGTLCRKARQSPWGLMDEWAVNDGVLLRRAPTPSTLNSLAG